MERAGLCYRNCPVECKPLPNLSARPVLGVSPPRPRMRSVAGLGQQARKAHRSFDQDPLLYVKTPRRPWHCSSMIVTAVLGERFLPPDLRRTEAPGSDQCTSMSAPFALVAGPDPLQAIASLSGQLVLQHDPRRGSLLFHHDAARDALYVGLCWPQAASQGPAAATARDAQTNQRQLKASDRGLHTPLQAGTPLNHAGLRVSFLLRQPRTECPSPCQRCLACPYDVLRAVVCTGTGGRCAAGSAAAVPHSACGGVGAAAGDAARRPHASHSAAAAAGQAAAAALAATAGRGRRQCRPGAPLAAAPVAALRLSGGPDLGGTLNKGKQ